MISPIPPRPPSPALGWLLLMPAVVGMLISLVLPSVQTVLLSFESGGALTPGTPAGFDNYGRVLGDGGPFWAALGFSLSLVLLPLLVALVAGPLLALALDRAGGLVRRAGVVVLWLSLIVFSPTAVAASWLRGLRPAETGLVSLVRSLGDPATAPGALRLIIAAATFGVVCALAVTAFLPALRGGTPGPAVLAVAGVVVLAMLAAGLQAFTIGVALTRGGPRAATQTPAGLQYDYGFVMAQPGMGATVATVTGLVLGVLGVAATIVAVATRMRLSITPRAAGSAAKGGSPVAVAAGAAALVVTVAVTLVLTWPWLSALTEPAESTGTGLRTQVNTWVPALAGAVVSVGTAYLAALGIGGLRPLGRRSEWLLLPFAPWLFVGVGPLSVAGWSNFRGMRLLDTFAVLVQPFLVSVPALLVLTLLCKGLAERTDRDLLGGVVLPSLPMAGVLTGAVTLVNAQDVLWPLLVTHDRGLATAPVAQMLQLTQFGRTAVDAALTTPLPVVVIALLAVVAAQLLYLDRLTLTVGGESRWPIPATPA
ncbi:sugar ABC transporter permease [Nonomuraea muscovyensis]|uniref:ABC-type sugar transport system permease subunit n=1 Tax=Nonomuraea muscovyensis TaxID=1124761 RepID=A0A7X0C4Y9_9ACTN|nr:sugar ABC transporter permease [Nonomuraea muscovyensis]MBB6348613.1 ABC-type sugar transport system permease subunit [Nonomuraea muscovyensis]